MTCGADVLVGRELVGERKHRLELAAEVAAKTVPVPAGLRRALEVVPRHVFISAFFVRANNAWAGTSWYPFTAGSLGDEDWLHAIYADRTLVTDISADEQTWRACPAPSVLAAMWAAAGVDEGRRVLEVGTGSGYGAALLSAAVGEAGTVHTLEWDVRAAERAARAMAEVGAGAHVHIGAPRSGVEAGAPYDCIVVNGSCPYVPWPLVSQLGLGGRLVVDWRGRWGGSLLIVTKTAEDVAGTYSDRLPGGLLPLGGSLDHWEETWSLRRPQVSGAAVADPSCSPRLLTEARYSVFFESELPFVSLFRAAIARDGVADFAIHDQLSNEVVWFEQPGDALLAVGPSGLRTRLSAALRRLEEHGFPENERCGYEVSRRAQWVTLADGHRQLRWSQS